MEAREGRREREGGGKRGEEGEGRKGGSWGREVRNRGRQISTSAESTLIMGQKTAGHLDYANVETPLCTSTVVD